MRKNLTHAAVESLKPHPDRQVDVWDAKHPGFGIRVSPAGTKTWMLMYRVDGRKHRFVLGRFPAMTVADARRAADGHRGDVARGENPAADRAQAKTDPTFGEFADLYLERYAAVHKRARSIAEDRKMLNSADLAPWKHRKLADIEKRDVVAVLDRIVARGAPIAANRLLSLLSKLFNFAMARDLISVNPATRVPREPEHARDRKLSDDELRRLWNALENTPHAISAALKLALLTGARRTEVLGMTWAEVDLDKACWSLPAERTKNAQPHTLPLVPLALSILKAQRRDKAFVFPGGRSGQYLANIKKPLAKLCAAAELENFHVHDLRRTVATRLAELGTDRTTLKKILNHSDRGDITAVYDRHSYNAEMRSALMKWERRLHEIVTGAPAASKVVELRA